MSIHNIRNFLCGKQHEECRLVMDLRQWGSRKSNHLYNLFQKDWCSAKPHHRDT